MGGASGGRRRGERLVGQLRHLAVLGADDLLVVLGEPLQLLGGLRVHGALQLGHLLALHLLLVLLCLLFLRGRLEFLHLLLRPLAVAELLLHLQHLLVAL